MELTCDSRYILLPVSYDAPKKRLLFYEGDTLVYDLVIGLEPTAPEFRFPVDMQRFAGKTLRVECDPQEEMSFPVGKADGFVPVHDGQLRPLVHFTSSRGWLNDPNGLVYQSGKYRMYYQHNPVGTVWGNMHWGSAESDDLIHWKETGEALFMDETGAMYSGSGFADEKNASGLAEGNGTPLLFFYTAAGGESLLSRERPYTQCLAVSRDGGKTLVKYVGNPLVEQFVYGNRDPKVVYYAGDDSYVMALFVENHEFMLLKSKDLLHWQELQRIVLPQDAECPDFYPLQTETGDTKWVLSAASDWYMIGSFDGERFVPETQPQKLNYGNASYAAQTWSGLPGDRRVRLTWYSFTLPGIPFAGCMSIPQQMSLRQVNGQLRLCAAPVEEIGSLVTEKKVFGAFSVNAESPWSETAGSRVCDVTLTVTGDFSLSLYGLTIARRGDVLTCGDRDARLHSSEVTLRVIWDTLCAEIFAEEGSLFMGMTYVQDSSLNRLTLTAEHAEVAQLTIAELKAYYEE